MNLRAFVMQNGREQDISDHIHPCATENGAICATVGFDYPSEEITKEDVISVALACSAFSTILQWICARDVQMAAARAYTLATWLNPVASQHKSLNQIAERCGVSRAALSRSLLRFRGAHGIAMTIGRLESSRALFREVQLLAVENGTHASVVRKSSTRNVKRADSPLPESETLL